jgi:hypothetical protein
MILQSRRNKNKKILIQKGQIHKNIFILNTLWLAKKKIEKEMR